MATGHWPESVWEFCSTSVAYRPRWSWKRYEQGHVVREAADGFPSLSAALEEARKHGFNDAHSKYTIA